MLQILLSFSLSLQKSNTGLKNNGNNHASSQNKSRSMDNVPFKFAAWPAIFKRGKHYLVDVIFTNVDLSKLVGWLMTGHKCINWKAILMCICMAVIFKLIIIIYYNNLYLYSVYIKNCSRHFTITKKYTRI